MLFLSRYPVRRRHSFPLFRLGSGVLTLLTLAGMLLLCAADAGGAGKRNVIAATDTTEAYTLLDELVVRPKRIKYSKKNNPAYDLMRQVRAAAPLSDPARKGDYSYCFHDKITLALNDVDPTERFWKKMPFLVDYADTAANTGRPIVVVSVKEKAGRRIMRSSPHRDKQVVEAYRSEGIDKSFNQKSISDMLEDVLRQVDIYDNDMTLMQNRFVSPLSNIADDFYRYYITDTLSFPGDTARYVELSFAPRNPETFGFNGRLYVAAYDSTRFIKRVSMRVPRVINLNYVDNIFINQEFERDSLGFRHKKLDDMTVEIQLVPGTQSFYARRTVGADCFERSIPEKEYGDYLSRAGNIFLVDESSGRSAAYWEERRIVPLSVAERNIAGLHAALRRKPVFYWGEKVLLVLANGYIGTGLDGRASRFDFGPVNTFVSYNAVEGLRLRCGGMTTAALSPHIFGRGYAAYGFHDHRWKYMLEGEYSFDSKPLHAREFPVHSLRLTHSYDIDMIGQRYLFTNPDNIFLSLKRKESYLATYRRLSMLEYTRELSNGFSVVAGLRHETRYATPWVPFIDGEGRSQSSLGNATFFLRLRYAPGEKFVQGRTSRLPINMDAPIFQLTHEYGPRGFLGSSYTVNITELSIFKRFWFSAFGYADVTLKAGMVWSRVQFPSLLWPNANLSYTIQPESYSLMNPMEFANDRYASLDLTYWLNGLILNRIPLIKKGKLREVFTFRLLEGGLSAKNNPSLDSSLLRFPAGESQSRAMTSTPYMEIGAGLDNIFTILRIDYVWRLTYRDRPGIDRSGLRISLHFSF